MIDGDQRRTLSPGRQIGLPQVRYDRHVQRLGKRGGVAELDRQPAIGPVQHGLSMKPYQVDRAAAVPGEQSLRRVDMGREHDPFGGREHRQAIAGLIGADDRLRRGDEHGPLLIAERQEERRSEAADPLAVDLDDRGVDAVERGAAHIPQNAHHASAR